MELVSFEYEVFGLGRFVYARGWIELFSDIRNDRRRIFYLGLYGDTNLAVVKPRLQDRVVEYPWAWEKSPISVLVEHGIAG